MSTQFGELRSRGGHDGVSFAIINSRADETFDYSAHSRLKDLVHRDLDFPFYGWVAHISLRLGMSERTSNGEET